MKKFNIDELCEIYKRYIKLKGFTQKQSINILYQTVYNLKTKK